MTRCGNNNDNNDDNKNLPNERGEEKKGRKNG